MRAGRRPRNSPRFFADPAGGAAGGRAFGGISKLCAGAGRTNAEVLSGTFAPRPATNSFYLSLIGIAFWISFQGKRTIVDMEATRTTRNLFFVCILLGATGLISPPIALAGGLLFAFLFQHPFATESKQLALFLLQASVVLLGFGMNLGAVLAAQEHEETARLIIAFQQARIGLRDIGRHLISAALPPPSHAPHV